MGIFIILLLLILFNLFIVAAIVFLDINPLRTRDRASNSGQSHPPKSESGSSRELYHRIPSGTKSFIEETGSANRCVSSFKRYLDNKLLTVSMFSTTKLGNSERECEDRYSLSCENAEAVRVGVSDGATESLFSGTWAKLLTDAYVEEGLKAVQSPCIEKIYRSFVSEAYERIERMPETRRWLMYEKMEKGTHATLAAVEFINPSTAHLATIGDSCIFWRNSKKKATFGMHPKMQAEDFNSFPRSICHLPESWKNLNDNFLKRSVELEDNFQMILCTDALACWLVEELQKDISVWDEIFNLSHDRQVNSNALSSKINGLRSSKAMKNDDVILVTIDAISAAR